MYGRVEFVTLNYDVLLERAVTQISVRASGFSRSEEAAWLGSRFANRFGHDWATAPRTDL